MTLAVKENVPVNDEIWLEIASRLDLDECMALYIGNKPFLDQGLDIPSDSDPMYARINFMGIQEGTSLGLSLGYGIRRDNDLVGMVNLALDHKIGQGELGYWLASKARGQGIATMAGRAICSQGFSLYDLENITMRIRPANIASQKVARRLGADFVRDESGFQLWSLQHG